MVEKSSIFTNNKTTIEEDDCQQLKHQIDQSKAKTPKKTLKMLKLSRHRQIQVTTSWKMSAKLKVSKVKRKKSCLVGIVAKETQQQQPGRTKKRINDHMGNLNV